MIRTRVGYAGGTTADPTYHDLGDHTESVQIDFDPEVISFEELLTIFWASHDPTTNSRSRQYRNVLFVHSEEQRGAAEASRSALALELGKWIETPIEPAGVFTRAEDYHQKYYLRHAGIVYEELAARYPEDRDLVDSTAAARLNGYLGGNGTLEQLEREAPLLGLSDEALAVVRERVEAMQLDCGSQ